MRTVIILLVCLIWIRSAAQENIFSLQQAVDYARKNNSGLRAADYEVEAQRQLKKTAIDLPKTDVLMMYGQYNSFAKKDNNFTITQSIPFAALGSQARLNRSLVTSSELQKAVTENDLVYRVKQTYFQLAYAYALNHLLLQEDSVFEGFHRSASLRFKTGETNLLERTTAEAQRNEMKNRLRQNEFDIAVLRSELQTLLNLETLPDIPKNDLSEMALTLNIDSTLIVENPTLSYSRQQISVAAAEKKVQASKAAPDLMVGYFNQTLIGTVNPENGVVANAGNRFSGFQVGISIPLWFVPHQGRTRAAEFNKRIAESKYRTSQQALAAQLQQAAKAWEKNKSSLNYYKETGLTSSALILKQSQTAFRNGEIGYAEYLLGVRSAVGIRENYLQTLNEYNQSVLFIEYLSGNKPN